MLKSLLLCIRKWSTSTLEAPDSGVQIGTAEFGYMDAKTRRDARRVLHWEALKLERATRFERATICLEGRCSTTELRPHAPNVPY